jgi:hypothetical protein
MHVKKHKRGGFIPAAALAGLAGRAALSWAVPKALNMMTKRKKGKGVMLQGAKGGALYMHGSKANCGCKKGGALYMVGAKPGRGIKEMVSAAVKNPMVQNLIKRGKDELKRHAMYAIENPEQAYKNVKKMVTGKGVKRSMKSLRVKGRGLSKKVGIESAQAGGTTSITISKVFKPNAALKQPLTFKQIKKRVV